MRRGSKTHRLAVGHLAGVMAEMLLLVCLATAAVPAGPATKVATAARPNVIFILADDLGWADLAVYGADLHETPNIDRMARAGVRFTQAYAMPVCSPTRATLMTGKHAARLNLTVSNVRGPDEAMYLAGAKAMCMYPVSIPVDGCGLNFTGVSYNGVMWVSMVSTRPVASG